MQYCTVSGTRRIRSHRDRPSLTDKPSPDRVAADATSVVPEGESDKLFARRLARHCTGFKGADHKRSVFQLMNTALPFALLCGAMWFSFGYAYWVSLLLALPTAGFLVRLFVIQHDCGHGSFFRSRWANDMLGRAISVLTLTPYSYWRRTHAIHHASVGDLDRRGVGDVDLLTIREYRALSRFRRLLYRLYRNPLVVLVIGPPYLFLLRHRSPFWTPLPFREAWRSVLFHDIALLMTTAAAASLIGIGALLLLVLPVIFLASWVAGWLFYVQHQFATTRWEWEEGWDFHVIAIRGSSYYVMPRILQWFTGNIGFHHIHHLCSMIPNYRLEECLATSPELQQTNRLTLRDSFRCIPLTLWDEDRQRLVSFREAAAGGPAASGNDARDSVGIVA